MAKKVACFLGYIAVLSLLFARFTLCDQATDTVPACSDVVSHTAPCLPYITHTSPSPSDFCCSGVQDVANMATSHDNEVAICNCLKTEVADFTYDPNLISELPKQCSVNLSIPPIYPGTNCSMISFGHGLKY